MHNSSLIIILPLPIGRNMTMIIIPSTYNLGIWRIIHIIVQDGTIKDELEYLENLNNYLATAINFKVNLAYNIVSATDDDGMTIVALSNNPEQSNLSHNGSSIICTKNTSVTLIAGHNVSGSTTNMSLQIKSDSIATIVPLSCPNSENFDFPTPNTILGSMNYLSLIRNQNFFRVSLFSDSNRTIKIFDTTFQSRINVGTLHYVQHGNHTQAGWNRSIVVRIYGLKIDSSYKDTALINKYCPKSFFTYRDTICANQSITFNGNLIKSAGTYRDTLINSKGCDSIISLIVTIYPIKPNKLIKSNDTLIGGSGFLKYQWYGTAGILSNDTTKKLKLKSSGKYFLISIDSNGCENRSDTMNINLSGILNSKRSSIDIFPNPASDYILVSSDILKSEIAKITIRSTDGRIVYSTINREKLSTIKIKTDALIKQTYWIELQTNQEIIRSKFLVE